MNFKWDVTECQCETCKAMCRYKPCIPVPDQMEELRKYKNEFRIDMEYGIEYLIPVTKDDVQGIYGGAGECIFYNGLCKIHSIKPMEGKLCIHGDDMQEDLHEQIISTWDSRKGKDVIEQWRSLCSFV